MENDDFKKDIEDLVRLFKKMKNDADRTKIPGLEDDYIKNLELFIQSYDLVKDRLTDESVAHLPEPVKKMIRQMVKQLREELGDDLGLDSIVKESDEPKPLKSVEVGPSLEEVDRMLLLPNLPDAEIDRLLDLRKNLVQK